MKMRVFLVGFGASALLLTICAWYAFASPETNAVLAAFDIANQGWYVHQPPLFNLSMFAFVVMNVLPFLVWWILLTVLDARISLTAIQRAVTTFGLLFVLSAVWWALIAKWVGIMRRKRE